VEKYGTAGPATDDNIIRRMRSACWITKTTDRHSEYAILTAFSRQQWLRERASLLRLYVRCLSFLRLFVNQSAFCRTVIPAPLSVIISNIHTYGLMVTVTNKAFLITVPLL
jgi:hypothetical protein